MILERSVIRAEGNVNSASHAQTIVNGDQWVRQELRHSFCGSMKEDKLHSDVPIHRWQLWVERAVRGYAPTLRVLQFHLDFL